jgi:hypothetical protein
LGLHAPENGCFYDRFGSGPNKWQLDGDWNLVTISPGGEPALTDSPNDNYKNAGHYGPGLTSYTTAATSTVFSLAGCINPILTFRHDYVLDNLGASQDIGRIEISTDGGATWSLLASYTGGGEFGPTPAQLNSPEWAEADWKTVQLDLQPYTGASQVLLRFSLEVDKDISDKGWVVDDITVKSATVGPGTGTEESIFLPLILK